MLEEKTVEQVILESLFNIMRLHKTCYHPADFTPGEIFVLSIIAHRNADSGTRISDVAKVMRVTTSAVTQFVKNLEARGLVDRGRDESDHRVVLARLTESGRGFLDEGMQRMLELFKRLVDHLGAADSEKLRDLLLRVLDFFDTDLRERRDAGATE